MINRLHEIFKNHVFMFFFFDDLMTFVVRKLILICIDLHLDNKDNSNICHRFNVKVDLFDVFSSFVAIYDEKKGNGRE